MCSGGTAYTAVKATECKPGDYVCVFGAGGGVGEFGEGTILLLMDGRLVDIASTGHG